MRIWEGNDECDLEKDFNDYDAISKGALDFKCDGENGNYAQVVVSHERDCYHAENKFITRLLWMVGGICVNQTPSQDTRFTFFFITLSLPPSPVCQTFWRLSTDLSGYGDKGKHLSVYNFRVTPCV